MSASHPKYWFMVALEWPHNATPMAEAAAVFAPTTMPREPISSNLRTFLKVVDVYADSNNQRVLWLSDVARWLVMDGMTWDELGVDWMSAVDELCSTPFLRLDLTLSQRAYSYLGDSSLDGMTFYYPDGSTELATIDEREKVHNAFAELIERDWPAYVERVVQSQG